MTGDDSCTMYPQGLVFQAFLQHLEVTFLFINSSFLESEIHSWCGVSVALEAAPQSCLHSPVQVQPICMSLKRFYANLLEKTFTSQHPLLPNQTIQNLLPPLKLTLIQLPTPAWLLTNCEDQTTEETLHSSDKSFKAFKILILQDNLHQL